ncbi:hypothetical protein Tco_0819478 [Tanacetum coccineum]|uniref:Uncharacterized protein n=1 Tax=Tanacetum coccineum TaxID=301880 RepID=A0ABQ5A8G1_9ASTR
MARTMSDDIGDVDIDMLTMEQYMALSRGNNGSGMLSLPWKPSAYSATGKPTPLPTTMTSLPPPPPPPPPPPSETTNDVVSYEEDVKFTLMSNSSGDSVESAGDVNVSMSPSNELFFKGGFPYLSVSRCHLLNGTIFLDDSVWVFGCGSCKWSCDIN